MKNLKLHLIWLVVALVLAAGLGRLFAGRKEGAFREKEKRLEEEIRQLKACLARSDETLAAAAPSRPADPDDAGGPGRAESPEGDGEEPGETSRGRPSPERSAPRPPATSEEILALLKSSKRDDRRRALREIARLEDKSLQMALLREAVRGGDSDMKYRAILMLDEIGKPYGTQLALEILQGGEESWVRARAARELSQLKDPLAIAALQGAFLEEDRSLKFWSAKALQALGLDGPVRQLVASTSTGLGDPDGAIREDLVERLGYLGSADALPHLGAALRDPNSRVRREAMQALGRTGLPAAVPILRQGLSDPRREVRYEAIDGLRDIGGPEALAALEAALNDPDPGVARRAREAIERLKNPRR